MHVARTTSRISSRSRFSLLTLSRHTTAARGRRYAAVAAVAPATATVTAPSSSSTSTSSSTSNPTSTSRLASYAVNAAVRTLQNGILETDDFYRNGVPVSAFRLSPSLSLTSIFASHSHIDPFKAVESDLRTVSQSIRDVLGSDHPVLHAVAKYFFDTGGKRFRPAIVFLIARAINYGLLPSATSLNGSSSHTSASESTSPSTSTSTSTSPSTVDSSSNLLPSQRRLSEITEMIHTASLLHDDVIDDAQTRRGVASINSVFGNKLAILGGDFLLARSSLALARLRNPDVIELLSMVIEHLVKGEIMQMKPGQAPTLAGNLESYITKSYYKTASLIANSCKAVAILGGHNEHIQSIAYEYGKNVGLAFQIVDDVLDFTATSSQLGKPALNDLTSGVITAPLLYAVHDFPQLQVAMDRKFKQPGDVEQALEYLAKSNGIARARALAVSCCENAVAAVLQLNPSTSQSALIHLVDRVLNREK